MRTCSVKGCVSKHHSHGMCRPHWKKQLRWGDALYQYYTSREEQWAFFTLALHSLDKEACINWPYGTLGKAYPSVKNMETMEVVGGHRLACQIVHGPAPTDRKYEAAHNCGNSLCINPHHIRWATTSQNQMDRVLHGTDNGGERHGLSRLTNEQAREIRNRLSGAKRGMQSVLCKEYGVSPMAMSQLARGQSYRNA